jgi:diphosphoinositol-polyphosphate diphosphatase
MCRCVPYRVKKDEGNPCSLGDDRGQLVEVLMISTPNHTDMVFPKVTSLDSRFSPI